MSFETGASVALIAIAILFAFLLRRFAAPSGRRAAMPYRREASLLAPRELALYRMLEPLASAHGLTTMAKVRLADILAVPRGTADRRWHLNRVLHREVDFVLCTRQDLQPILAVVVDRPDARGDPFVDQACAAAALRVAHIPSAEEPDRERLEATIRRVLQTMPPEPEPSPPRGAAA